MKFKARFACLVPLFLSLFCISYGFAQQVQTVAPWPFSSAQGTGIGTTPRTGSTPGYQQTYPPVSYGQYPPAYPQTYPSPTYPPTYPQGYPSTYPGLPLGQQYPSVPPYQQLYPGPTTMAPPYDQSLPPLSPGIQTPGQMDLVPRPWAFEPLSPFEQFMSGQKAEDISFDIKQFGYDLFRSEPYSFLPVENVPVSMKYVIGPDDIVRVAVWGSIEGAWDVRVDRDGNIALPKAGVIGVAGLNFGELKNVVHKELSKYFTDFEMNVSLGQLRSIRVYVVGNVKNPGAYSVSALSTIINALFVAGGPEKTGSMRDIQLKRDGKTIAHLDLYDFLLRGDKTKDHRLMPEDIVFVPPIGDIAGVAGHVKRPAIYEMRSAMRVMDLIDMAGGLTGNAFKGRFQILRVENHQLRKALEGTLMDAQNDPSKNILVQDQDLLQIFPVTEDKNLVVLSGAVHHPGEFAISPGQTTVRDVVSKAGGLKYFASDKAEITRVLPSPEGPKTEHLDIDLKRAVAGDPKENLCLQNNDYIIVHQVPEWDVHKTVTVWGEVKSPGIYTITRGEKLSSLIERAGGYSSTAYPAGGVFIRESVRELQQRQIDEMANRLQRELLGTGTAQVSAAATPAEAQIIAKQNEEKFKFITSLKEVRALGRMVVQFDEPKKLRNTDYDIELAEGDQIFIPTNPHAVQVIGAVYNQTSFVHEAGNELGTYITMAGGYTDNADEKKVYILKANGTALRPKERLHWNSDSNKWAYGSSGSVEPGDTIVVPDKLERFAWMRNIKDVSTVLFQIATTAGVLLVL